MNQLVSRASAHTYKRAVKPLLFKQKPDTVHKRMLKTGGVVQKVAPVRSLLKASWAYENPAYLTQTILGITFKNPIGLSAGFDKNFELLPMVKSIGFGYMEGGSITYQPCVGNAKPWFYRLPRTKSLVVHVGLANQGAERILKRLRTYSPKLRADFPLNISVAKTNSANTCTDHMGIEDYVGSLTLIKESGLGDLITINISCPNTFGGEPFTTPRRLEKLLGAIDALTLQQPVFIKMPCLEWEYIQPLLEVANRHQVHGITLTNLAKERSKVQLKDPLPDAVEGGLSGKPTWEISNELIRRTYRAYGDRFIIIGVGGVFSAEDAYTKIRLGASLVELITGMIFEGPQLIGEINRGLVRLLKRDGFTNVRQAIGVDAKGD